MAHELRRLCDEDQRAAWELTRVAFGLAREMPHERLRARPGRREWGVFDSAGRLVLEGGEGRLEPGGVGRVRLGARGLAVLYAGAADFAALRRSGLLCGGDANTDALLLAATAGPAPALLDYF